MRLALLLFPLVVSASWYEHHVMRDGAWPHSGAGMPSARITSCPATYNSTGWPLCGHGGGGALSSYWGAAAASGQSQTSRVLVVGTTNLTTWGAMVRMTTSPVGGYHCDITSSGTVLRLSRCVNGSCTQVASTSVSGVQWVIELEASGSTLACAARSPHTGTAVASLNYTDAEPLTGGYVGLGNICTGGTACGDTSRLWWWQGGDTAEKSALPVLPAGPAVVVSESGGWMGNGTVPAPLSRQYVWQIKPTAWTRIIVTDEDWYYVNLDDTPRLIEPLPGRHAVLRGSPLPYQNNKHLRRWRLLPHPMCRGDWMDRTPDVGIYGCDGLRSYNGTGGNKFEDLIIDEANLCHSGDGDDEMYGTWCSISVPNSTAAPTAYFAYSRHYQNTGVTRIWRANLFGYADMYGLHVYNQPSYRWVFENNVLVRYSGIIAAHLDASADYIIRNNHFFNKLGEWSGTGIYTIQNNWIHGGHNTYRNLTLTGNRYFGGSISIPAGATLSGNRYWAITNRSEIESRDNTGTFSNTLPSGQQAIVIPTETEPGRAIVVAYNWSLQPYIPVDLSSVLKEGDDYEIYQAWDSRSPVLTGRYQGGTVQLWMGPYGRMAPFVKWRDNQAAYFTADSAKIGQRCGAEVAIAEGWQYGTPPAVGSSCTHYQLGDPNFSKNMFLATNELFNGGWNLATCYCSGSTCTWQPFHGTSNNCYYQAKRNAVSDLQKHAFYVRKPDRRSDHIRVVWHGSPSDTLEAGIVGAGTIDWTRGYAEVDGCNAGLCQGRIYGPAGLLAWRINGGETRYARAR